MSNTIGTGDLAAKVGVDPRTVQTWVKLGLPTLGRGKFDPSCVWWIIQHYKDQAHNKSQEQKDMAARKLAAEAEIQEEKLSIIKGEHTPNYEIVSALSQLGFTIKSSLRGLKRLAKKLHGRTIPEISMELDRVAGAILREISETEITFDEKDKE